MKKALASIIYIFALSLVFCPNATFGATLNVPTPEYPTIQDGIDAAVYGDTVLVADGTYTGAGNKNLDFGGKAITVQSQNGPENCIIDCEHDGRGFYFLSGEGEDSVVSGFTITNGGEAIRCGTLCYPTITNCNISGNDGDGIYGYATPQGASFTITNCTISGNGGDGIALDDTRYAISGCTISMNSGNGMSFDFSGGTINNCTVLGNDGTGIAFMDSSSIGTITNCTILGNNGAGLWGMFAEGFTTTNCTISENGGCGIYWERSRGTFTNCMILGNDGPGIFCEWLSFPTITNCTISENNDYGIYCSLPILDQANAPIITNSIFWDNSPGEIFLDVGHPTITVTYSDIQGGYTGEGNIDENPLFADPEYGN